VGRQGSAGDEALKDRILLGARRRVDMGGRKIAQPLDGWNVVVGSCPSTRKGTREKKRKASTSVGRKVPSSEA